MFILFIFIFFLVSTNLLAKNTKKKTEKTKKDEASIVFFLLNSTCSTLQQWLFNKPSEFSANEKSAKHCT